MNAFLIIFSIKTLIKTLNFISFLTVSRESPILTESAFDAAMRQAKRQLLDEQFHAQFPEVEQPLAAGSSSAANPDFLAGVAAPTITGLPPSPVRPLFPQLDVEIVRKTLPFLQDLPDDYLRAHSYDQLVAANATLAKMEDKSASAAIGKRLTANYNELKARPIRVEAGWDD